MNDKIYIGDYGWWPGFITETSRMHQYIFSNFDYCYSEKPHYILCSVFGDNYKQFPGIRILQSNENQCPDFNIIDYAIGMEYLQFGDRYCRVPNWIMNLTYEAAINDMMTKHLRAESIMKEKKGFCSFVYSNDNAQYRKNLFHKISIYKNVDAGGKVYNNIGERVESKIDFERWHRFSMACENSMHIGYSTEKIVQSFAAGTVPIYWGDPEVGKIFNEKAFINVMRYENLDEVIDVIEKIDNDENLYFEMLSQPALLNQDYVTETIYSLEKFLEKIFRQDYSTAFRRNRI